MGSESRALLRLCVAAGRAGRTYAWVRAESGRAQVLRLFGCQGEEDKQGGFFAGRLAENQRCPLLNNLKIANVHVNIDKKSNPCYTFK